MKRHLVRDIARSLGSRTRLRYLIAVMRQLGGVEPRECNLCGYAGLFRALDHPPRYDAECPRCGSRERARLFGLLLEREPAALRGRVIHFAPEASLAGLIRRHASEYRSADLRATGCDLSLDIERMALPDASVDTFILNHVLEHVDDRKALAEIHRCLAPGGSTLISLPIVESWRTTYEDGSIARGSDDRLRALHFGQADHLRFYGADLRQRIADAGFALSEFVAGGADCARYGLIRGETIFWARKAAAPAP